MKITRQTRSNTNRMCIFCFDNKGIVYKNFFLLVNWHSQLTIPDCTSWLEDMRQKCSNNVHDALGHDNSLPVWQLLFWNNISLVSQPPPYSLDLTVWTMEIRHHWGNGVAEDECNNKIPEVLPSSGIGSGDWCISNFQVTYFQNMEPFEWHSSSTHIIIIEPSWDAC